jgi:phytoene dehydrogenase-like protein
VTGVRLADGEQLPADAVVSTISAGVLARLLPAGALPGRLQRRLEHWRYGTGAFKLDYALAGPVPWTAPEPRNAAVVHVAGALEELTAAAQAAHRGQVPGRPALVVGQQSLLDRSRAP